VLADVGPYVVVGGGPEPVVLGHAHAKQLALACQQPAQPTRRRIPYRPRGQLDHRTELSQCGGSDGVGLRKPTGGAR
jgi:hypothetical protein